MPLDLYLLRHGETVASQTGGYCGALDLPLTPAGEAMAAAFADRYQSLPWQAVFVSPLQRAVATARPLCQAIGLAMQERSGLREIQYGEWEGQTADQVKTH
ncbi:MAG: histidine phosphatase family protein, partial [Nodosilinea sp.]